jgi:translation initiation factor IF-3
VAETTSKELRISDPRTNERIRVPEVRLVGPAGEQIGVVRIEAALRLAQEADLDLVEVAPNSKPPVVKIMDYGKFKYEAAQKAKEARRNQANTILKEVRFRLKIEAHDYTTKLKRAEGFLKSGDKVKAMILFRGREQSRPEQGVRLLRKFAEDVAELGVVESNPTIDGRNMVMVVAPLKNKSEAKAEQNAVRTANKQASRDSKSTSGDDADAPNDESAA